MTDPTRPLPYPSSNSDGLWQSPSITSPKAITTMGAISLPPVRVIPVVVLPGIMGTNLRATTDPNKPDGARNIAFVCSGTGHFQLSALQDVAGDGTVPIDSGAQPTGKVRQIFATTGYDHQGSYSNGAMLALTQHLIVKIVQEVT